MPTCCPPSNAVPLSPCHHWPPPPRHGFTRCSSKLPMVKRTQTLRGRSKHAGRSCRAFLSNPKHSERESNTSEGCCSHVTRFGVCEFGFAQAAFTRKVGCILLGSAEAHEAARLKTLPGVTPWRQTGTTTRMYKPRTYVQTTYV